MLNNDNLLSPIFANIYPLDFENKITYNNLSVKPQIIKPKTKQIEENFIPSEDFMGKR